MRRARVDRRAMADGEDAVPEDDLSDPNPDVEELFAHYDELYFRGALAAAGFAVKWGATLHSSSFGSCTFSKPSNTITLSEPVLKYRSCTDRKKALLHEMIHAIVYVKHHRRDCNQHGPDFRAWMDAINSCSIKDPQRPVGGYNITTRHDFGREEPRSFKGVLWKCKACGDTDIRAANQGPPSDACCIENVADDATCGNMLCHWHNHKNECGGPFEKMGLHSVTPGQKKVLNGTHLLLACPPGTSKSQGSIQESGSEEPQENSAVRKPNAEDEHLSLVSGCNDEKSLGTSSSVKAGKKRRSQAVRKASVLLAEPSKEMKRKQVFLATEKNGHFSPAGCNDAKSLASSTSKKAGKQHEHEDVQKPSVVLAAPLGKSKQKQQFVPTEKHKLFSLEDCSDEKSLVSSSLLKAGKRRRSEVVQKASVLPVEPPNKMKPKQDLVAMEKHELFSPTGCNDAKSPGSSTSKKAGKQHKPEDVQRPSVLPAAPQGKLKLMQELVPTEKRKLFSLEGCNDAKSPGSSTSKKAGNQYRPEDFQKPNVLPAVPQGKPKPKQKLVTTETHKLSSLEACNDAKSLRSNTKAGERHKPESVQKPCSQTAYSLRGLKKGLVASEKNELSPVMGCSNEKLLDRISSKKAGTQHEPDDIQKITVLPATTECKLKEPSLVALEKQKRKRKRKHAIKEFAVMSEWMNIYESDRSSGSTESLINKRTERRKRERERERKTEREKIQTYSRSKKEVNSAPLDNSRINASVSSHGIKTGRFKDESSQQSLPASPFSDHLVTQATGDQSQPSATCLDVIPLPPVDPPGLIPSDQSTGLVIDISDDD